MRRRRGFYTAGTTGVSKAVPLSHRNILTNLRILMALDVVGPADRVVLPLPLHHAYPLIVGLLLPLASGATVILPAGIAGPDFVQAVREGPGAHRRRRATALRCLRYGSGQPHRIAWRAQIRLPEEPRCGCAVRAQTARLAHRPLPSAAAPRSDRSGSCNAGLRRRPARSGRGVAARRAGLSRAPPATGWSRPPRLRPSTGPAPHGSAAPGGPPPPWRCASYRSRRWSMAKSSSAAPSSSAATPTMRTPTRRRLPRAGSALGDLGWQDGGRVPVHLRPAQGSDPAVGRKERRAGRCRGGLCADAPMSRSSPSWSAQRPAGRQSSSPTWRRCGKPATPTSSSDSACLSASLAAACPAICRIADFVVTREPLPRNPLGKYRRFHLPALFERTGRGAAADPGALSEADRARLSSERAVALMAWLAGRFPEAALHPDTSLQMELGIDSLSWLDLSLDLERTLGVRLSEETLGGLINLRDLVDAVEAARPAARHDEAERTRARERLRTDNARWLTEPGPWGHAIGSVLYRAVRLVARTGFRLRTTGAPPDAAGRLIILANHLSDLDPAGRWRSDPPPDASSGLVGAATRPGCSAAGPAGCWRASPGCSRSDDRAPDASLERAAEILERGRVLVWFPEEWRSPDGTLSTLPRGHRRARGKDRCGTSCRPSSTAPSKRCPARRGCRDRIRSRSVSARR